MNTETVDPVSTNRISYNIDLNPVPTGDPFTSAVVSPPPVNQTPPVQQAPEPPTSPITTPGQEGAIQEPIDLGNTDAAPNPDSDPGSGDSGDSEINPYYYLGEALKGDGYLPEGIEVTEKIDASTVYNGYKQKLREDLEPQVRQEIYQKLQQEGINQKDLLMARALNSGVDPRLLQTGSMFETYATLPDDSADDQKVSVIKQMYQHRQFKEDEIKRLISSAEADENINTLFAEGKQYFADRYNEFVDNQNQHYLKLQKDADQKAAHVNTVIRNIISTGNILDEKLSKEQIREFEDALRKEDQTIEVDGVKYRGSEMQKFLVDFEQSPEMKFPLFKLYKFRNQEKDKVNLAAVRQVENDFLKAYETKVISSKKADQNQQIKSQLESKKATASSIFIDLSPQK